MVMIMIVTDCEEVGGWDLLQVIVICSSWYASNDSGR